LILLPGDQMIADFKHKADAARPWHGGPQLEWNPLQNTAPPESPRRKCYRLDSPAGLLQQAGKTAAG
jgi:hypothetical protein